jgi:inner membrane protein
MRNPLLMKTLTVAGLALLLLIPLAMVAGLVESRNARQIEAADDIARLNAGRQQLTGPLLVARYEEQVVTESKNKDTGETVSRISWVSKHQVIVPKALEVSAQARVDTRKRGLFKAQAYDLDAQTKGRFSIPRGLGLDPSRIIRPGRATLLLGLTDLRGLRERPVLRWAGRAMDWQPGGVEGILNAAVHVNLGSLAELEGKDWEFEMPLALRGSQAFSVAPVAEVTRVSLTSPWPSPSFQGRFSARHNLSPQGFTATWEVFHLARSLTKILDGKGDSEECFGVAFLEPVNVYLQAERATKYGFLFVGLVFAAFFFVEVLRRMPIHPLQYLLVGLSLAIFFLLLLSLSEHIPFGWAYLASSLASLGLLAIYLVHVLRSARQGLGFTGGLALIFALLYGLLLYEDSALLMGSAVLFLGLAAVMIGTRKVDWYALGQSGGSAPMPGGGK